MKEKIGSFFATLIVWSILINGIVTVPWTVYLWLKEKHKNHMLRQQIANYIGEVPESDDDEE